MSGVSPFSEIDKPLGVYHLATVILREVSDVNLITSWTDPFPNVFSPTKVPIPCSDRAPAKISEAEADPLSTKIISFEFFGNKLGPLLVCIFISFRFLPISFTIVLPSGMNNPLIETAASK